MERQLHVQEKLRHDPSGLLEQKNRPEGERYERRIHRELCEEKESGGVGGVAVRVVNR